jgi:hypothetical protein
MDTMTENPAPETVTAPPEAAPTPEAAQETARTPETSALPDDWTGHWAGKLWRKDGTLGEEAPEAVRGEVSRLLAQDADQFRAIARQCELSERQAAKLFDLYGSVIGKHLAEARLGEARLGDARQDNVDPRQAIAAVWPTDTDKNLDVARRGARAAGLGQALDEAGLSANPLVLRLAHALGEALSEDSVEQGGGASLPTGPAAREELYRVIGSEAYRNGDNTAYRLAEALSARVHIK